MKKSIIMIVLLATISTSSLFAKSKQQINIYNDFGKDIVLKLKWEADNLLGGFDKNQEIYLHPEEKTMIKAPYSLYHLDFIDAASEGKNLGKQTIMDTVDSLFGGSDSLGLSNVIDTGYNLKRSLNHDKVEGNSERFFIVTRSNKMAHNGEQQIIVKRYNSQDAFELERKRLEKERKRLEKERKKLERSWFK